MKSCIIILYNTATTANIIIRLETEHKAIQEHI